MINNIKKILLISRPISWVNTAYPFAAGYLVTGGRVDLSFIISTLYFLIPYNLLMYGVNDVFDYESDIKNPRKGGIEGMREQKSFHPTIIKVSILSNLAFLFVMSMNGSLLSNLVLLGLIFFVVAYSVKGLRFKEVPFLDSLTSSIHFTGPLVYALTLTQFSNQAWLIILAFLFWGMASHAFGAVQDIIPDRKGHISSVATSIGARNTVIMSVILYALSSLIMLSLLNWAGIILAITAGSYIVNIWPYINISDKNSAQANKAWRRFIWLNMLSGFVVTLVLITVFLF